MHTAGAGLLAYLAAQHAANRVDSGASRADLYTLVCARGTATLRYTTYTEALVVGGNTYLPMGGAYPIITRSLLRQSDTLAVDSLDLTLTGAIGGVYVGQLALAGYFDGATLTLQSLIMPTPGDVSLGAIATFDGTLAELAPQGPTLSCRAYSPVWELANRQTPRMPIATSCGWLHYSTGCGLVKATFTLTGTVSARTATTITTATAAITAKAANYYDYGVLSMTSGVLSGQSIGIASWASPVFTLVHDLAVLPGVGDSFSVYPGCNRSRARCLWPYVNTANFRGMPHIPDPQSGV